MTSAPKPALRVGPVVLALILLTFVSGCASRGRSFVGRFVKPGEPSVSFDAPKSEAAATSTVKAENLSDFIRRLRAVQANARTGVTLGNVLESVDPALAASLLKLKMLPSAANHREVAQAYARAGVNDFAHRHWQRALQIEPCDSKALEGLARLWRHWNTPSLALSDAHRAVHCRPQSPSAHNTLGTVLVALGQLEKARKAFEVALRLDGTAAFAMNNLCYVALQEGDGRLAQHACEKTLALDPSMAAAHTNLALAHALQGNVSQAESQLLQHADEATGLFNVGVLRMAMNHYAEAASAFDLAAGTRPSLAEAARRAVQARVKAAAVKEQ